MGQQMLRLTAVEADSIIECIENILRNPSFSGQKRRRLGLACQSLTKARQKSRNKYVRLDKTCALRLLRCFAELNEWSDGLWHEYFG